MLVARRRTPLLLALCCLSLVGCSEEGGTEEAAPINADEGEAAPEGEAKAPTEGDAAEPAEPAPAEDKAAAPTRRFVEVKGGVTMDGKPVEIGTEIPESTEIVTAKNGYAVITLAPGSIIEIRKGSKVKLGSSERRATSLRLFTGALWSIVASGSDFEVETDNAVAGVRGTVFFTEAHGNKKSYVCACDGTVEITGKAKGSPKKTPTSQMGHKAFFVQSAGKKDKIKDAKRLNHTEEEKAALLSLLERAK